MAEPDIGNVPFQEAIDFFRSKLNISTKRWDELRGDAHARMFTVAGATKGNVLQDLRDAVDDALADGTTITEFRKRFDETVAKHGWDFNGGRGWRTRVIFDTNLRSAHAAGRWQQVVRRQRQVQARNPHETIYLVYETAGDLRVRPAHRAWDRIIRPVDDPFWDTHYPPNGYGCRCIARVMTGRQLERRGIKPTTDGELPEIAMQQRINRRTGEILPPTPAGIDTGFGHNVGKAAWFPSPGKFTDPGIGHHVAATAIAGPEFEKFVRGEVDGVAPVGHIDDTLAGAIGATAREVRLSAETMRRQRENYPGLTISEYRLLPPGYKSGQVIRDGDDILVFVRSDGRLYRATTTRSQDGRELFVTSFQLVDKSILEAAQQRGTLIRQGDGFDPR